MELIPKDVVYTAEKVSIISAKIKAGKARELPNSIYHSYDSGHIYVGVGDSILVKIGEKYERVDSEKYLLRCSLGGTLSVVDTIYLIQGRFKVIEE